MKLHPATQILIWCVLVAAMQFLTASRLLALGALVLLLAFALSPRKFLQLVRRTRWIMLSLWVIYAYSTPGQDLYDGFGIFSPSREGLLDGGLQLMRLLAALAALAMLLDRLHRQQLMAGLYTLFAPLQWLGVSRERLTVRLALTLHYAEVAMLRESRSWQVVLRSLFEAGGEVGKTIELPLYRFALIDVLLMLLSLLTIWMVMR
ncbi:MAG: CbiQ family ECF transporter T component [Gallionella sp.]|nr:CbiQ family ECF transporter T component [Gallionella sp.]MDD4947179.1 CbiQ family ECF transporter T component [Gallionella sp.]MDD5611745.1 CbiQ family ECF transporter T component [Gallionella sp.]